MISRSFYNHFIFYIIYTDIFILVKLCYSAGATTCHQTRYISVPGASSSYHIKHFKLNILVRSCFYWLCLFFTTLTIQYGILKYSEFSLKWPYWPKSEVKHFTYLLTYFWSDKFIIQNSSGLNLVWTVLSCF